MCPVVTTQAAVTTAAATKTFLATRTTTAATEAEREAARGAGETSTEILVPTPMTGKNGGHFLSKVLCYFSHLFGGAISRASGARNVNRRLRQFSPVSSVSAAEAYVT